jgi:serine/threonine protein kinase
MDNTLDTNSNISHYRIISKLGAGGMGEVHLAEDACLERKIALKILPKSVAQDEEMKLAWYPGWYDFGTIYIQNRSTLFDYFQLEIWAKFKFYAGFIEFCAKHKIVNSAFAMLRSVVYHSLLSPDLALSTNTSAFVVKIEMKQNELNKTQKNKDLRLRIMGSQVRILPSVLKLL